MKSLRNYIIVDIEAFLVCKVGFLDSLQVVDHFLDVGDFGIIILRSKPVRIRAGDNFTFDCSPAVKVVF